MSVIGSLERGQSIPEVQPPSFQLQALANGWVVAVETDRNYPNEVYTAKTIDEALALTRNLWQRWEAVVNKDRQEKGQPLIFSEANTIPGVHASDGRSHGSNGYSHGQKSEAPAATAGPGSRFA